MNLCALCRASDELRMSHVVPKFAHRWLKTSSPGGIRSGDDINRRIQDGWKERMLCDACEGRIQKYETSFANGVFHRITKRDIPPSGVLPYGPWALKFAVSVSWRALVSMERAGLEFPSQVQRRLASRAAETWRGFLLGHEPHPGEFEQHAIAMNLLAGYSGVEVSPMLNRYFMRTVAMDCVVLSGASYVYTKLGPIILVGFIQEPGRRKWRGTKIHLREGSLELDGEKHLPEWLNDYWNAAADGVGRSLARMSKTQKDKIHRAMTDDPKQMAASEVFRSFLSDLQHSGQAAFDATASLSGEEQDGSE